MEKEQLLDHLLTVERNAQGSKFSRFLQSPYKYVNAILFRELIYKRKKKSKLATCRTFFGDIMKVKLPAATDIYLTGGKTHDSEIRLAGYMINNLKAGDQFLDVGAHYGYFSLLAGQLVGKKGQVHAFEAAHSNFQLLKQNTRGIKNIRTLNKAASDTEGMLTFYEFPALYSEYNSMNIEQYVSEDWFNRYPPVENKVQSISLSNYIEGAALNPDMIKIDVEGAEEKVIKGLKEYISSQSPIIIMEYLSQQRRNSGHEKAAQLLEGLGYQAHLIGPSGKTTLLSEINSYFSRTGIDSDNLVFKRS